MKSLTTRQLVLTGATLVGAATAATSATSLYELAVLCGIPDVLAAALPIALDAGAGVAALVWIAEHGERRAWGRGVAIAALAATLAGNGVQHAITSGLLQVTLPLVLVVGACIPAMLFCCVHLAALMARPAPTVRPLRTPKPRPGRATPSSPDPVGPRETAPDAKVAAGSTALDWARQEWPVTAKEIQLGTGVAKGSAHRIHRTVRAERAAS